VRFVIKVVDDITKHEVKLISTHKKIEISDELIQQLDELNIQKWKVIAK
jgi:hypothetical protein